MTLAFDDDAQVRTDDGIRKLKVFATKRAEPRCEPALLHVGHPYAPGFYIAAKLLQCPAKGVAGGTSGGEVIVFMRAAEKDRDDVFDGCWVGAKIAAVPTAAMVLRFAQTFSEALYPGGRKRIAHLVKVA